MNTQKEAEYIAEIVRLKAELKQEKMITCDGFALDNGRLMKVAGQCLTQIADNEGCHVSFTIRNNSTKENPNGYKISGVDSRFV